METGEKTPNQRTVSVGETRSGANEWLDPLGTGVCELGTGIGTSTGTGRIIDGAVDHSGDRHGGKDCEEVEGCATCFCQNEV